MIADNGLSDLQARAVRWHTARFPYSKPFYVTLKAMAELGEVADAVIAKTGGIGHTGDGITGEAADVVITLMILTGRWLNEDLLAAVDAKLTKLETPGAHIASLG